MLSGIRRKINCKTIAILFLVCAIVLFGSSGVIYARSSVSITNDFATGLVNISLTQYDTLDENGMPVMELIEFENILPGQTFYRTERIQNLAADCYIRLTQDFNGMDVFELSMTGENWTAGADGYMYYTEVLKSSNFAELNMEFYFDKNAGNEHEGSKYHQNIRVEAIQAANFTPDFGSERPWGDVEIIDAIYETGYDAGEIGSQTLKVVYQGDMSSLITDVDDAFKNFATLMPGDKYSDCLKINNNSENAIKVYFKSTVNGDSPLHDALILSIYCQNEDGTKEVVFEGPLSKSAIETRELMQISSNKSLNLEFSLTFPEKYDNSYSLMKGDITWILSTEEIIDDSVKTGDDTMIAVYLTFAGIMCLFVAIILKRVEDHKEKYMEA